jgi:protein-L-isoaspartate(D-aspartate) O-methyltransferase
MRPTVKPCRRAASLAACGFWAVLCASACQSVPTDPDSSNGATEWARMRAGLVESLRADGITDPRVLAALGRVPRHEFVPPADRARAYDDRALPIGRGQTISQPYVVALMTQLLELHGSERVLEVGTGSGYQAAVLALVAREVYTIEIDAVLAAAAEQRLRALGYDNVHVRVGDGFFGWQEAAPFDDVIVTAAAPRIPQPLVTQLKSGGRLVMPLGDEQHQTLVRARKLGDELSIERVTEVQFVPMTGMVRKPAPATP